MYASLLHNLAPTSTLAVEDTDDSRALVQIPYLEQTAKRIREIIQVFLKISNSGL